MSVPRLFWLPYLKVSSTQTSTVAFRPSSRKTVDRGSSGIGRGKSIELAEGILLPSQAIESNSSRPKYRVIYYDYIIKWCSGHRSILFRVLLISDN